MGRVFQTKTSKRGTMSLNFFKLLRELEQGEFNVFGPAICKGVTKVKISKSKTTHPEPGKVIEIKPLKVTNELKQIIEGFNQLPKEEEKKKKDIQDLQKEVLRLREELRMGLQREDRLKRSVPEKRVQNPEQIAAAIEQRTKLMQREVDRAFKHGYSKAETDQGQTIAQLKRDYTKIANKMHQIAKLCEIDKITTTSGKLTQEIGSKLTMGVPTRRYSEPIQPSVQHTVQKSEESVQYDDQEKKLDIGARKIYSLLYENQERQFSKIQIAVITGYSVSSGGFNNSLSVLRSRKLIQGGPDKISINEIDESVATEKIGEYSIEFFLKKLSKCEREILQLLLENPDIEFSKEELGEQTKYSPTSGGFNNAISRLNSLNCIKRNEGRIKLNPELEEMY